MSTIPAEVQYEVDETTRAVAVRAVAAALRPSHRSAVETRHAHGAEDAILTAMREEWDLDRVRAFWLVTGPQLTASLEVLTGCDETTASYMVGAALHAVLLGGQDTAPDAILRLAERAACWESGRQWAVRRVME